MGIDKGLGYRDGGEGKGLDQDLGFGVVDLADYGLRAATRGAEIDLGRGVGQG